MAKMCLVTYEGSIMEIVDPGKEYEIYNGEGATLKWVLSADDDVLVERASRDNNGKTETKICV